MIGRGDFREIGDTVFWPDARYVDEAGQKHTIYYYQIGNRPPEIVNSPGPPATLSPGATVKFVVAPGYKTYEAVEGCRSYFTFEEPLIPSKLGERNEEQMNAHIAELARSGQKVKLVIPVRVEGYVYQYWFTFTLRDRWAGLPNE